MNILQTSPKADLHISKKHKIYFHLAEQGPFDPRHTTQKELVWEKPEKRVDLNNLSQIVVLNKKQVAL